MSSAGSFGSLFPQPAPAMSSAADSKLPHDVFFEIFEEILRRELPPRELPHDVEEMLKRFVEEMLKRFVEKILKQRLPRRELPQDVVEEILKRVVKEILKRWPRELPDDLVNEILKRLPVSSLLLCKRVCKSWGGIIDDSHFMNLHLKHSVLHTSNWHLVEWCGPPRNQCFLISGESKKEISFGPTFSALVGSCNSLICVADGPSIYLWNLFIRKHIRSYTAKGEIFSVGFGFHPESKDYRITMIVRHPKEISGTKIYTLKCTVLIYSLKKNEWKDLKCWLPAFWDSSVPTVCLNGNMHWFDPRRKLIVKLMFSVDLTKLVFNEMILSEEIVSGGRVLALVMLNELLAVCTVRKEADSDSACSVWVKGPESWIAQYSFSVAGQVTRFDGFMRNGELLMVIDNNRRVSWDPASRGFTNHDLLDAQSDLVTVVESLLPQLPV